MLLHFKQIKSGELEVDEVIDRAIFWKKARKPKDGEEIDEELAKMNAKIVSLLKY